MKLLINAVVERLAQKLTAVRYIDENWGQLDSYSPNHPVKWPVVLVDIKQVNWSNQGQLIQTGIADVNIRLA